MGEKLPTPEDIAAGNALRAALAAYDETEAAQQVAENNPITRALQETGQTITSPARAADALAHAIRTTIRNGENPAPGWNPLLIACIEAAELQGESVEFSYEEDPFTKWRREQSTASLRQYAQQYGLDPATATWKDITDAQQAASNKPAARVESGVFDPSDIKGMNQFLVDFFSETEND